MNQTFKRAMSLFMALAMVFSMVPSFGTHAHAEELETEPVIVTEAPATEAPVVETPVEEVPETEAPTQAPETEAPVVETEAPEVIETEAAEETEAVEETEEVTPDATEETIVEEFLEEEVVEEALTALVEEDVSVEGCSIADLEISYSTTFTKVEGTDDWSANGEMITGNLVGGYERSGAKHYYRPAVSTLTLKNKLNTEATLSFTYSATTNGAGNNAGEYDSVTVDGTVHTASVTDQTVEFSLAPNGNEGDSVTIVLSVVVRAKAVSAPAANGATITISNLFFASAGSVSVAFETPVNGSYTVDGVEISAVENPVAKKTTEQYALKATPDEGYAFAGWYNMTTGKYISADLEYSTAFAEDCTVAAKFLPVSDGVYGVGEAVFGDLTAAAQAAVSSSAKTVVLLKDATLTDSHVIPFGVTLLVPYDEAHSLNLEDPESVTVDAFVQPTAFRTLTMAAGSSITVEGAISVNAPHHSCQGSKTHGGAVYGGKYGEIKMQGDAKITLKKGANLYAWGYIWGSGSVEALSGATIYEKMQVTDYRGGSNTAAIATRNMPDSNGVVPETADRAFPFNQYYIQNVEVKEILHEGAALMAHAAVNLAGEDPVEAAVEFIGSSTAMFSISGATITKEYISSEDRLSLTIDGDENSYTELNGLNLSMGTLAIDSAMFTLPINSNIDIKINAGAAVVNQELVLQPGVRVNVAAEALLATNANIYVMDADQWGEFVFNGKRQQPVIYSPSLGGASNRTINSDAVIDINGYVMPIGGIYTTEGGAKVISSEKSGIIEFGAAAPEDDHVYQITGGSDSFSIAVTAAKLTNGNTNKPFTETKGAAMDDSFYYCTICDCWHRETDECVPVTYTITWKNTDGEILYEEDVAYGTTPAYDATKGGELGDACHILSWTPAIAAVTGEAEYTAVLTEAHTFTQNLRGSEKTAGTCMAEAVYAVKCDKCDAESDTLTVKGDKDPTNHTGKNTTGVNAKAATCTEDGYTGDTVCECDVTVATGSTIDANGHTFGETTAAKAATCQAAGNEAYKQCETCKLYFAGDAEDNSTAGKTDATSFVIAKKEHSYTGAIKSDGNGKDATHSFLCVNGCGEYGAAEKHTWNAGVQTTAPGCESEGVTTYTCTAAGCDATYTEPVDALEHKDENNDHTCDNGCGIYQGEHADGEDDKDHLCDYCNGEVEDETCYDYDQDHNCDECDATTSDCVDEDIKDHYCDYDGCENYMGTHTDGDDEDHLCDYGCNEIADEGCHGGTAYCNASAKCEECGEEYGDRDPNNHASDEFEYYCDNYDGTHNKNRTCCGEEITNEPHTYNPKTHVCDCGAVEHFTLTVQYIAEEYGFGVWKEVELTVAYGSKLNEHPDISIPDGVYTTGFDTSEFKGDFTLSYYAIGPDADHLENVGNKLEEVTMPAYNAVLRGVYLFTGWHNVGEGWTYEINDVTQKTGWTALDNNEGDYYWYYLDPETGYRAEGIVRVPYPTEIINGITYGPNDADLKYAEDNDIDFIDKDEAWFVFGDDGKFLSDYSGPANTQNKLISWAANGQIIWHVGAAKLAEDTYAYFIGDEVNGGNIMATGDVYVSRVCDNVDREFVIGGIYTFGEDGILCKYDGITDMADGTKRYYEAAQLMVGNGLTKVGDNYIYVRSNGELVVSGQYWIGKNYLNIATGMYSFDENGYMIDPVDASVNGVVNGYYYVNGRTCYAGLIEYNGGIIYVTSSGKLATGKYYVTKTNDMEGYPAGFYYFDANGYLETTERNGIVDGKFYKDGEVQYNLGLIEYNGGYIYVRSNGMVATGTYWITNTNGLMDAGCYEFGENGYMIIDTSKNGIYDGCYYVDGIKQIGIGLVAYGDSYIYVKTNGELATGAYWVTNVGDTGMSQGLYTFGADGIMIQ